MRAPAIALALLTAVFASCTSQKLVLSAPPSWQEVPDPVKPRWVIAYPAAHHSALAPLKRHRARQGYEVITLPGPTSAEINAKAATLHLGNHPRDCLVLVGSVPSMEGRYDAMEGLPSDNRYALDPKTSTPLFALGRFPTDSAHETSTFVRRILAYEEANHPRQANFLIGNPMGSGDRMQLADTLVTSLSKNLMKRPHSSWRLQGAADIPRHPFGFKSDEFPRQFRRLLDSPYAVGTYFGHSSSRSMCSTDQGNIIFGPEDWRTLQPSNSRGLFFSCGCYTLRKADAVGTTSVKAPGGPVAYIGASRASYSAIGYLAAKGLTNAMTANPPATVGEWWMEVQRGIARESINPVLFRIFDKFDGSKGRYSLHDQRRYHLEMWNLLGDPATRLF